MFGKLFRWFLFSITFFISRHVSAVHGSTSSCVMNFPSLPSREQVRAAGGVKLLMLEARLHCRSPQLDAAPATWLSSPRMTYELWPYGPPGSGGQQLTPQLWRQEDVSSVCLCQAGLRLVQAWFLEDNEGAWRNIWRNYGLQLQSNLFLESHSMGGD